MNTNALLAAARVPVDLLPWKSPDGLMNAKHILGGAFLFNVCMAGLQRVDDEGYGGYTVMDDCAFEICRHFEAVYHAKGRVLKTGLGLGCFVRMCLTKPEIEHIDVVEIDPDIAEHFGRPFADDPRVTIHVADAFEFPLKGKYWDMVWHDIYEEGNEGLQLQHGKLIKRYADHADLQGAWAFPKFLRRRMRETGLGF
ncbi:MAG: hypothetical protein COA69_13510 [Robiginitomaculum sp.]|nr:MAG: hypothetical protein COA69_13510 [Robiginitomaculum sp.]